MPKKTVTDPTSPWELSGTAPRFANHRVAFSGKFEVLRKKEVSDLLVKEGSKIDAKLATSTTLLVYAREGSANHKRALSMQAKGGSIAVVDEDGFRQRYLVPTPHQVVEMLGTPKDRKRLELLLSQAREEFSRGTDEYSEVEIEGRKLAGADLSKAKLFGVRFESCDLRRAKLDGTKLSGADGVDLRNATGKACSLSEFRECDLRGAELSKAELSELEDCRLDKARLSKLTLGETTGCRFNGATLDGLRASYGELRECSFEKASLAGAKLESVDIEECSFAGADLRKAVLKGGSSALRFADCDLSKADFRGATLSQVRFERCELAGAKFAGARLSGLEFADTDPSSAVGLDWSPPEVGAAQQALLDAAPTFKKIHISAKLRIKSKTVECELYMFDHGQFSAGLQAWLDGENVGALQVADAIATIARLSPGARLLEDSLVVKSSKGKTAPSLKPKQLRQAVLDAWNEALASRGRP